MVVTIFDKKFREYLEWLDIKQHLIYLELVFYLIDDKIGGWYECNERQNIWNNRKFRACKILVVWIVLKFFLNLVVEKIMSARNSIKNSIINITKGKEKLIVPN